eukprot:489435_1
MYMVVEDIKHLFYIAKQYVKILKKKMKKEYTDKKTPKLKAKCTTGTEWLAWAICNADYEEYNKDKATLDKEEQAETSSDKTKLKVDEALDMRHREILFEFHENYTSYRYCKRDHEEIVKIFQVLDKNNALK